TDRSSRPARLPECRKIIQCRPTPTDIRSWTRNGGGVPSASPPAWVLAERRAVGETIRAARLHASLTQDAVALAAEIDRPSVRRPDRGRTAVPDTRHPHPSRPGDRRAAA